ncbi:ArnT family glycosyltransferase [Marivirga atlantica]|uniref:Glycosyltransferase family 39 protein n=1 Tax=Marivirga atlantica TaxID=1548457 RepID=A0A937DES9_9BACT|nr:glycosyltransferase family 39 protein [Marivirga atlantica]MBL0765512.1 glycosyltransferase family 39 protein [Marivirga atlantica]
MKKYWLLLTVLVSVKLILHLFGNINYGFHRDELLHLSVSEHLAWGYFEFPPMIAFIGKIASAVFGYSLGGIRLFSTLAGISILLLSCTIAKEMGAKWKGILLTGICILAFLPFYRNHTLFQPVAFNQLIWTIGFYSIVRYANTSKNKYLIITGIILGLGLLTKYTILVWAFGVFTGLLVAYRGKILSNKWFYLSGLLALLIFLPNLIWQLQNDFPLLQHLQALKDSQLDKADKLNFITEQLELFNTLIISLIGLIALLALKTLKKYRSLGISILVIFITMWIVDAKAYYVFGIYPALFAAGSTQIEKWFNKKPVWLYTIAGIVFLLPLYFIPQLTPILPIEQYLAYKELKQENGRYELTGDYADMFGWEEQVALVDSVYNSLSEQERNNCVIWAENYGEAGAVQIIGDKYGLPDPICRHGSFWSWGYGNPEAEVWISLGNEAGAVNYVFDSVTLIKTIKHPYAIEEENNIPLYLCRNPKIDIPQWWTDSRKYIFD